MVAQLTESLFQSLANGLTSQAGMTPRRVLLQNITTVSYNHEIFRGRSDCEGNFLLQHQLRDCEWVASCTLRHHNKGPTIGKSVESLGNRHVKSSGALLHDDLLA